MLKKLAILTAGGDCPGINAVLRAAVRRADRLDVRVLGLRHGFAGLGQLDVVDLPASRVSGILPLGGSILRCSGADPFLEPGGVEKCRVNFERTGAEALIAIGGEHTMQMAHRAAAEGIPVVGVPKTIDNDVRGTDVTFGFDTAVSIAAEAIDRLHTTAESHDRVMVVEVMGRQAGWIATFAGLAAGADAILIPERPVDLSEVCAMIRRRHATGKDFSIVVAGEGARFRGEEAITRGRKADGSEMLGGIGEVLADRIRASTGIETRVTVLGHVLRGGSPTARDRVLASRYGAHAVDMAAAGRFGRMASLRGGRMTDVDLAEAAEGPRLVDPEIYELASNFFG